MRSKILDLLRQSKEECVSGEEIAKKLAVSRTAIWKHIRELRQAGYEITSHPRSGYCLAKTPDLLLPDEVKTVLETKVLGRCIEYFKTVDSTNNVAKDIAAKGAAEGTVIISETQSGGRGRISRGWFSPEGLGVWFSIILRPKFSPQHAPKCTLMAAVALTRAIEKVTNIRCGIKWPNDILYGGKKIVGILTEMSAEMDAVNYVAIGMGINVNVPNRILPEEIQRTATSLLEIGGRPFDRKALLAECLKELEIAYDSVSSGCFDQILDEWRAYSITLGQEVNVIGINETFSGKAADLDEDGALLVDTPEGRRRVLAGDVSIRPTTRKDEYLED